jgi:ribosomal protein S27E
MKEKIMTDEKQHCPGFEANKTLSETKVKCPGCGKETEVFSDELGKTIKCSGCGASIETKKC